LTDSYLDEDLYRFSHDAFISLAMDTDKFKIFGARVKVDGTGKQAELERAEKVRPVHLFFLSF
jgi:hypothetical protein